MPTLELFFTIEDEEQLIRRLNGISSDLKDFTPEFNKVGGLLLKTFKINFSSQGKTLGEPWVPLKSETLEQKKRYGFPADILVRSGNLRDSFRANAGQFQVTVSNLMDYFKYHQSNKPRRKLPRRIMMKIDNERKQDIVKIFQEAAQESLKRRGFNKQ